MTINCEPSLFQASSDEGKEQPILKTAAGQDDARETRCLCHVDRRCGKSGMKPGRHLCRSATSAKVIEYGAYHGLPIDRRVRIKTVAGHQIHRISFYPYSACLRFMLCGKLDRHRRLPFKRSLVAQTHE